MAKKLKVGAQVLWLDTLHGRNEVESGTVIFVGQDGSYVISWLEGYKSRTDDVPHDRILSVQDPKADSISIGGWTGNGVITEAGAAWLASNLAPVDA